MSELPAVFDEIFDTSDMTVVGEKHPAALASALASLGICNLQVCRPDGHPVVAITCDGGNTKSLSSETDSAHARTQKPQDGNDLRRIIPLNDRDQREGSLVLEFDQTLPLSSIEQRLQQNRGWLKACGTLLLELHASRNDHADTLVRLKQLEREHDAIQLDHRRVLALNLQESDARLREQESYLIRLKEEVDQRTRELRDQTAKLASTNTALEKANRELESEIDERRRVERALLVAREAAEMANRAKSQFLANMSHEIRTPMTAVLGYTEILLEDEHSRDPSLRRTGELETIYRNGEHLLALLNDILDISKIEADKLEVERVRFSPVQVVSDVITLMQIHAQAKELTLESRFLGPIPQAIESDPLRLRQILTNLLGNAIKFTASGGVTLAVQLHSAPSATPSLQFEVIDTGIGIPESQVQRLFQPFTQADSSTTRVFGGTGLGLAICKRLAELLGGTISVRSWPGKGSTFTVTIATGQLDDVPVLENPSCASVAKVAPSPRRTSASIRLRGRILLADDSFDNQRLIAFHLRKAGADVVLADNGQAAVDLAVMANDKGQPFDVILMDMQMPVLDGYAASRQLRMEGYCGTIIALTASIMPGTIDRCLEAGCDAYAGKPISRDTLLALVASHLGRDNPNGDKSCPVREAAKLPPNECQNTRPEPLADEITPDELPAHLAVFDYSVLLDRLMGNETVAQEIIEEIRRDFPQQHLALRKSLESGDLAEVQRRAHRIRGSAANIGAFALQEAVLQLEKAIIAKDLEGAASIMPRVDEQFDRLLEALSLRGKNDCSAT